MAEVVGEVTSHTTDGPTAPQCGLANASTGRPYASTGRTRPAPGRYGGAGRRTRAADSAATGSGTPQSGQSGSGTSGWCRTVNRSRSTSHTSGKGPRASGGAAASPATRAATARAANGVRWGHGPASRVPPRSSSPSAGPPTARPASGAPDRRRSRAGPPRTGDRPGRARRTGGRGARSAGRRPPAHPEGVPHAQRRDRDVRDRAAGRGRQLRQGAAEVLGEGAARLAPGFPGPAGRGLDEVSGHRRPPW